MNETSKENNRPSVERVTVDESSEGQRLDNFLIRHCKGLPKSRLYRMVRNGEVRVNGSRAKVGDRLRIGDAVRIPPLRLSQSEATDRPTTPALRGFVPRIVFEDEAMIAIDKPAGVAVHGGSGVSLGVIEALRLLYPHEKRLELVHRLDRDTSGLLLVAKKRAVLLALHEALRLGTISKRYLALVEGEFGSARRKIDLPLSTRRLANGERRSKVDRVEGRPSVTVVGRLETIESFAGLCSLVEAFPKTGRTHQIRVHLASIGFPIVGDDKYGRFEHNRLWAKAGYKRMFLHAAELVFSHPLTGERQHLQTELPDELSAFLACTKDSNVERFKL